MTPHTRRAASLIEQATSDASHGASTSYPALADNLARVVRNLCAQLAELHGDEAEAEPADHFDEVAEAPWACPRAADAASDAWQRNAQGAW